MKNILASLLILMPLIVSSQAIATSSGISVQGLLKDSSGTPLANLSNASLRFTVYYLDSNSSEISITSVDDTVNTDDFGIFSYVVNIGSAAMETLAFYQGYMKIENGTDEIFNQKLHAVPYATYAKKTVTQQELYCLM